MVVTAALAVAVVVPSSAAQAAGTLDQQQPVITQGGNQVFSGISLAQTFTAGLSGALDQVDVAINEVRIPSLPTAPLVVEIRDTVNGLPGPTIFSSGSIAPADVPDYRDGTTFVSIPLTSVAPVHAGTLYALTLSSATSHEQGVYQWFRTLDDSPDLYPAGSAVHASGVPLTWVADLGISDWAFKTYVASVDETAPTVTIDNPDNGALYLKNSIVAADYACADEPEGSGIATCAGPVPNGAAIDTSTSGSKAFTVNAADNAGNTASATVHYRVCKIILVIDPLLRLCL
jgi:hypothetical protein